MANATEWSVPPARKEGLVVKHLADEVLVYDLERHKAHCLNKSAAFVWNHCDGSMTVSQMSRLLECEQLGNEVGEEVVLLALDQLGKAHLLVERANRWAPKARLSRREVMKRIGVAAAVGLPLVTSLMAPTAQASTSCNKTCLSDGDCVGAPSGCTTICSLAVNLCIG